MNNKIFIVDDNKNIIRAIAYILSREGYRVISTQKALDSLAIARKEKPGLIILDVMMPDKSGYQICQEMKADAELKKIPVVFISARVQEKNKKAWRKLGVKRFITKPFQAEEIKKVTNKILGENK
jgi:DNA-binding response OmpR family regulator